MSARIVASLFGSLVSVGILAYQVYRAYELYNEWNSPTQYAGSPAPSREKTLRCRRCKKEDSLIKLVCGHFYHRDCLQKQTRASNSLSCSCGEKISSYYCHLFELKVRECMLCEEEDRGDNVIRLSCNHKFHTSCLCAFTLIRGSKICSQCKQSLHYREMEMLKENIDDAIKKFNCTRGISNGVGSRDVCRRNAPGGSRETPNSSLKQRQRTFNGKCTIPECDKVDYGSKWVKLDCGHSFHSSCVVVSVVRQDIEDENSEPKCFVDSCNHRITTDEKVKAFSLSDFPIHLKC